MKKGLFSLFVFVIGLATNLSTVTVVHAESRQGVREALPDLPVMTAKNGYPALVFSPEDKVFAKKYPNTASAIQQDLYSVNLLYYQSLKQLYTENGETFPIKKTLALLRCIQDIYQPRYLHNMYQQERATLSPVEFNELEQFYGSPAGKKLLNAKLKLAQHMPKDVTMTGKAEDFLPKDDMDFPAIQQFMASNTYEHYLQGMEISSLKNSETRDMQCIAKVIQNN